MVSVIIPVWNDAACLETLLQHLSTETGLLEIIVADGGSTDGVCEVVRRFPSVQLVFSERGRGRQMNAGARAARGEVLLFLHADTLPPKGAPAELPSLLDAAGADFGAFRLRFEPSVWPVGMLAWFTRFASPWCCFGDQGIFVRRDFFQSTGGFPEIPLLEDARWLRTAGRFGRMTRSPRTIVASARRFQQVGAFRQTLLNAVILIRDLMGEDPATLAEVYRKGYRPEKALEEARSETRCGSIDENSLAPGRERSGFTIAREPGNPHKIL